MAESNIYRVTPEIDVRALQVEMRNAPWRLNGLRAWRERRLFWITRGQGRIAIDARTRGFGPNMLYYIPPTRVHALIPASGCRGYVITIKDNVVTGMPDHPLRLKTESAIERGTIASHVEQIRAESTADDPAAQAACLGHLTLLSVWIARHAARDDWDDHATTSASQRLARNFLTQLEARLASGPRVDRIAAALSVSPAHLGRVCTSELGKSATRLIQERQVLEARFLLADTSLAMGRIASAVGVSAPATFTRLFRRHAGMTPRDFRASLRR